MSYGRRGMARHLRLCDKPVTRIHVTPITGNPGFVVDYAAKSPKMGLVSEEDIIILPRAISELPSN